MNKKRETDCDLSWLASSQKTSRIGPATGTICRDDLLKSRHRYISDMLRSELSALDKSVVESIASQETLTESVEAIFDEHLPLGDRWAGTGRLSWRHRPYFACHAIIWARIH